MTSNKKLIDIERKINDFFASEEFKTLVLKHDAKENSYAPETFTIYNNSHIEEILDDVNKWIHEIEESYCFVLHLLAYIWKYLCQMGKQSKNILEC